MTAIGGANIRITGDESGLISSLNNARRRAMLFTQELNSNVAQGYKRADAEQKVFRAGLTRLGSDLTNIGQKTAIIGALPALFAVGKAYKDYTELQRMSKGLTLYGETLDDVRRLAKEPNIGVFDGAKALVGLRAVKLESSLAERAIKSFANAITAAGGNQADLEPALFNLKQFKGTRNINQVDLRQLANRIPQSMDVIEKAFGTTDVEKLNKLGIDKFIEGFITLLEKIPKVEGLAASASEQAADSFTFFSGVMGEGADKAFGITSALKGVSDILDNAATGFKSLSPEAQKAIFYIGGLAVVVPALTIAVGGLISAWPLIAAGLSGIVWPVVAIVATTTVLSGLALMFASAASEVKSFSQQQELVASYATKLDPLIAKYDELKSKTKLTADEQKTLKDITKQIADFAPVAVTGWDKYGNAIDISTGKVKTHTEEQKKLLEAMQATRREAILAENRKSDIRKSELRSILSNGSETRQVNLGMGQFSNQTLKLNGSDLQKYSEELGKLNIKDVANRKELLSLGAIEAFQKETLELRGLVKERIKVREQYAEALKGKDFNRSEDLRIKSDSLAEEIKKKRSGLKDLIPQTIQARRELRAENAIVPEKDPQNTLKGTSDATDDLTDSTKKLTDVEKQLEAIDLLTKYSRDKDALRDKVKEYKNYVGVVSGLNLEMLKTIGATTGGSLASGLDKAKAATTKVMENRLPSSTDALNNTDAKRISDARSYGAMDLKSVLGDSASFGEVQKFFDAMPLKVGESVTAYEKRVKGFVDATHEMNAGLTGAVRGAAGDIAVGFGEMLGNLMSGVGGIDTFAKNVMSRIGSLLKDLGKSLIGFGTAGIALKVFAKNPATALAAGVGLVALGQVVSNSVKDKASSSIKRFAKGAMVHRQMTAIVGDNANARVDGEMIAPYSKVDTSIAKSVQEAISKSGGGGNIFIPDLVIRGEDLHVSFNRVQARNKALAR